MFWSIKYSGEVLSKLKSRGFRATSLSTYDFSTLYTTLPHNLIKEKLLTRQTACLVFNPIMVEGYAALFSLVARRWFRLQTQ